LLVVPAFRNDDRVPLRQTLASIRTANRCAIRGDALFRQAGGISTRLSRCLCRIAHELPDSRLGNEGDDQHRKRSDRRERAHSIGNLHLRDRSLYGFIRCHRRIVGRLVDRPVPVRSQNGSGYRSCVLRNQRSRRHARTAAKIASRATPYAHESTWQSIKAIS